MIMAREVNLLAQFTFPEHAEACAQALRDHGFDVIQIDQVPSHQTRFVDHTPVVEWGRYGYQPNLIDDKWTAASSWDNPDGLIGGQTWLLTAVVEEDAADTVRKIIAHHGGTL